MERNQRKNSPFLPIQAAHGNFEGAGRTFLLFRTVDTTLLIIDDTDTVAVDTFLTIEIKGFLSSPRSITVDARDVIYICDTPNSHIVRYRLSNTLDENVTEEK
ncbi:MAG: hypothetical protein IIA61_00940 [Candidatus Marinimicrobia bacterium]|nr:hypothetical protein [Candidatus Neomarinimicrobiota bacterium]